MSEIDKPCGREYDPNVTIVSLESVDSGGIRPKGGSDAKIVKNERVAVGPQIIGQNGYPNMHYSYGTETHENWYGSHGYYRLWHFTEYGDEAWSIAQPGFGFVIGLEFHLRGGDDNFAIEFGIGAGVDVGRIGVLLLGGFVTGFSMGERADTSLLAGAFVGWLGAVAGAATSVEGEARLAIVIKDTIDISGGIRPNLGAWPRSKLFKLPEPSVGEVLAPYVEIGLRF